MKLGDAKPEETTTDENQKKKKKNNGLQSKSNASGPISRLFMMEINAYAIRTGTCNGVSITNEMDIKLSV